MQLAVFADIHANRQAFEACLKAAQARGAERFVLLGDFVGYGADPEWVVDRVAELVAAGAIAIGGNHDLAVSSPDAAMNSEAQIAIEWTRGRLDAAQRRFLADLPLEVDDEERLYVHADASNPARWNYVHSAQEAARCLVGVNSHVVFCGHVHQAALYSLSSTAKMTSFVPKTDVAVRLLHGRQWLAVMGSVGQPRDRDPSAAYGMFNTDTSEITFCRAPYDVEEAARRIRHNGLPHRLADRLLQGR
ncbi:MAG: metallophosphatase family protein [Alphaproteobacteria bacterium]|nr:metallophosphatase family protein [Alphaproteobacteria bacterium]